MNCKYCKDEIYEVRRCSECQALLTDVCRECHNEIRHSKIGRAPKPMKKK